MIHQRKELQTDCGILGLWDAASFEHLTDYESWDRELGDDEDLIRQIEAGKLIPMNMGSDGVYSVEVRRASPDDMSPREREFLIRSSPVYLLKTTGKIRAAGLEEIGPTPRDYVNLEISPGEYAVNVYLIDWSSDPSSVDENGDPNTDALPDLIVLLYPPAKNAPPFSREMASFTD